MTLSSLSPHVARAVLTASIVALLAGCSQPAPTGHDNPDPQTTRNPSPSTVGSPVPEVTGKNSADENLGDEGDSQDDEGEFTTPESGEKTANEFLGKLHPFTEEFRARNDWCIPLDKPVWKVGADADFMKPDDPVIGFMTEKNTYAIPWWVIKNHHVANLDLDDEEILITLCELCSSASAFDPRVDGERLYFRIVGIYNGTHILGDRQTGTYWLSFLGKAKHGPHEGKQLRRRRIDQATWADWLELHPETQVAFEEAGAREGHGSNHYPGLKAFSPAMRESIQVIDTRLPSNALILGVTVNGEDRAYPMKRLTRKGPLLQDQLGDQRIVVFHKPNTWMAAAFSRQLDGKRLDFELNDEEKIIDRQTQSTWNLAGVADSGPLRGKKLQPVTYIMEEWFIWVTYHPQTSIWPIKKQQATTPATPGQ